MTQTVLVTGGAGYIGSHTCKALAEAGFSPVTYDNLSVGNSWAVRWGPLERGDVTDLARLIEVFRTHKPVGVVHFAALSLVGQSMHEPGHYFRTNFGGALAVMDAAKASGVDAFVFSSTCAVYGTPPPGPITEATPRDPINPYGASKLMVERALADYDAAHGFRSVALRYFNACGADPQTEIGEYRAVESHLIPIAIEAMLERRPPLKIFGTDYPTPDGTAIRDYIHVSDLAEAHVRALRHLLDGNPSATCNLGTGTGYSVNQIVEAIGRISGTAVPTVLDTRRAGDATELVADPSLARQVLGPDLTPRSDLDTIIDTALDWHRSDRLAAALG